MSDINDPIDGLIRYVNEIKPFHSKIIEVLTEYVYTEELNVTLSEKALIDVGIVVGPVDVDSNLAASTYGGGYGNDPYDSSEYFPIIAINPTLPLGAFDEFGGDLTKKGYEATTNRVTLPGDQTATYRPGREVEVEVTENTDTGSIVSTTQTPSPVTIVSSTYITTGQTNGISDNPHTQLILSSLNDEGTLASSNNHWTASIKLLPVDVVAVVLNTNTNTGRIRYNTVPMFGPGTLAPTPLVPPYSPPANTVPGDGNITTLDNYIEIAGDVTGSYPFGSTLIMLLADTSRTQYSVTSSYFNGTNTFVEVLQELAPFANYTGAQVVEGFFGYSEQYVFPTTTALAIPEGLTQTTIDESILFNWTDGTGTISPPEQFIIHEFLGANQVQLAFDGRDPFQMILQGSQVNIIKPFGVTNTYTVDSVAPSGGVVTLTGSPTLNSSTDTGFLETT